MTPSDTRDPVTTLRTSDNASDPAVSWKVKCLNCGAALAGPFCAECGQRALPARPTVRELIGDALAEFAGWDGKFAETIRLMVRKPGELTRQWLEGRRVHFISPLRLYLTASLAYFVVAASAPQLRDPSGKQVFLGPHISVSSTNGSSPTRPERVAKAATVSMNSAEGLTAQEKVDALKAIQSAPSYMRPMLRAMVDDPAAFRKALMAWMPRVLFALLPIFAGILALFYRGRHYPEHLYFAIHLHAFIFFALLLGEVAKFTWQFYFALVIGVAATLWIIGYALLALRRVYGGSLMGTLLRGIGIAVLYAVFATPALVAAVFLAAM